MLYSQTLLLGLGWFVRAGEVSTPKNNGGDRFESLPQKTCFDEFLSTKVSFYMFSFEIQFQPV